MDACGARVEYHELAEETFTISDVTVTTQYMNHTAITLGYRIEADGVSVVYCTDHEPHDRSLAHGGCPERASADDRHCSLMSEADLVIHDCQYTAEEYCGKEGWGHSTVEYVVDMALHAQVQEIVLFHHDPCRDDDGIDALVDAGSRRARRHIATTLGTRGLPPPHKLRVTAAREQHTMWLGECGKESFVPKSTWLSASEAESYLAKGVAANGRAKPGVVTAAPARKRESSKDQAQVLLGEDCGKSQLLLVVFVTDRDVRECVRGALLADARMRPYFAESLEDFYLLVNKKKPPLVVLGKVLDGCLETGISLFERVREQLPHSVCIIACENGQRPTWHPDVADWLQWPFTQAYARTRIHAMLVRHQCKWVAADRCHDEERRLAELRDLKILDTAPDPRLDAITSMCVLAFKVSFALVSFVDADRQWFKSKAGKLSCSQTSRDESFCAHAILQDDVFEVSDATTDPRFADNPLVTGELRLRFYAGAPLATRAGHKIGTLCILDDAPRKLTASEAETLKHMSLLVTELILCDRAKKFASAIASGAATASNVVESHRRKGQQGLSLKWPPPQPATPKAAHSAGKPTGSDPLSGPQSSVCSVQ